MKSARDPAIHSAASWRLPALFLLVVTGVYATALTLRGILPGLENGALVAVGMTLDLAVVVPCLYYFLMVRRHGWPAITLVPVTVASFLLAARVVPGEFHGTLDRLHLLAVPLELLVLGIVVQRATVAVRRFREQRSEQGQRGEGGDGGDGGNVLSALRIAARETLGVPLAAEVFAFEAAVFYYGLFSWRRTASARAAVADDPNAFTVYRKSGYPLVLGVLLAVMVIELVAVHVLVHLLWSPLWAWILTGLSVYGLVWILADFQALRLRPLRLTEGGLCLRIGFRWEVEIPWQRIREVQVLDWKQRSDGEGRLNLSPLGEPALELVLREPVTVRGIYGLRRSADRLGLTVDDPDRFLAQARTLGDLL